LLLWSKVAAAFRSFSERLYSCFKPPSFHFALINYIFLALVFFPWSRSSSSATPCLFFFVFFSLFPPLLFLGFPPPPKTPPLSSSMTLTESPSRRHRYVLFGRGLSPLGSQVEIFLMRWYIRRSKTPLFIDRPLAPTRRPSTMRSPGLIRLRFHFE